MLQLYQHGVLRGKGSIGEKPSGKAESPTSKEEEEELPALFWDTLPEDPENNPDYAGIQAIIYGDSTPEETAENFKVATTFPGRFDEC